jgi:uncharacterized protein YraI
MTQLLAASVMAGSGLAQAADRPQVVVADPYLELHTGPGAEFPVFHVVERGESVELLNRRTDWFKVRTHKGIEGWASRTEMENTLTEAGMRTTFRDVLLEDYLKRRVEAGIAVGQFESDPTLVMRLGYQFAPQFGMEWSAAESTGTYSTTTLRQLNFLMSPFTESRFVPFVTVGVGSFHNTPSSSLIGGNKTDAHPGNAGFGLRAYITRSFTVRADYREYMVPITDSRVEKYKEMTLGLGVFF